MPAFLTRAALRAALGRAWNWITASMSHILIVVCVVLVLLLTRANHQTDKWHHIVDADKMIISRQQSDYRTAQAAAAKAQRAINAAAHEKSRQIATAADRSHDDALTDARRSADAYAASHGLHAACVGGASGGADRAAQAGGAGVPASLPADAVVLSRTDLQAATDAVTYAIAAHNLAADQIAAGLAE